jgi:hypothetical protein
MASPPLPPGDSGDETITVRIRSGANVNRQVYYVVVADAVRDHPDLRGHRADPATPERDHRHPKGRKASTVVRDPRAIEVDAPHYHLMIAAPRRTVLPRGPRTRIPSGHVRPARLTRAENSEYHGTGRVRRIGPDHRSVCASSVADVAYPPRRGHLLGPAPGVRRRHPVLVSLRLVRRVIADPRHADRHRRRHPSAHRVQGEIPSARRSSANSSSIWLTDSSACSTQQDNQ